MVRLLTLLMIFALAVTNGAAVTAAMCQHGNSLAHAAALESGKRTVSQEAVGEEAAAKAISKKASFTDAAASVTGYILPANPLAFPMRVLDRPTKPVVDAAGLASRSLRPLLEPPLA